jgi:predicted kinase
MVQFEAGSLFSELLVERKLSLSHLQSLAEVVSSFHRNVPSTPHPLGEQWIRVLIEENLETLAPYAGRLFTKSSLRTLQDSVLNEINKSDYLLSSRGKSNLKLLHGDLHLRNICLFNGRALPFDGIEFGDDFAICDPWCDIAFTIMDLLAFERTDFARQLTNLYLEYTDDFGGLALLRLFISYRAQVRAKVAALSPSGSKKADQARLYVELATQTLQTSAPMLIGIGGFSGSGKSTLAAELCRQRGLIHVRSDAVRKHLLKVPLTDKLSREGYSSEMGKVVYEQVRLRAKTAIAAGYPVIVDAVHQSEDSRQALEQLAVELGVPFLGLWCEVSSMEAKRRIEQRKGDISDADVAVRLLQEQCDLGVLDWQRVNTGVKFEEVISQVVTLCDEIPSTYS